MIIPYGSAGFITGIFVGLYTYLTSENGIKLGDIVSGLIIGFLVWPVVWVVVFCKMLEFKVPKHPKRKIKQEY